MGACCLAMGIRRTGASCEGKKLAHKMVFPQEIVGPTNSRPQDKRQRITTMLPSHGRYIYHPWQDRASYAWPGGAKLAVYLGLNLEHFAFGEELGAELAPGGPHPDELNHA